MHNQGGSSPGTSLAEHKPWRDIVYHLKAGCVKLLEIPNSGQESDVSNILEIVLPVEFLPTTSNNIWLIEARTDIRPLQLQEHDWDLIAGL